MTIQCTKRNVISKKNRINKINYSYTADMISLVVTCTCTTYCSLFGLLRVMIIWIKMTVIVIFCTYYICIYFIYKLSTFFNLVWYRKNSHIEKKVTCINRKAVTFLWRKANYCRSMYKVDNSLHKCTLF